MINKQKQTLLAQQLLAASDNDINQALEAIRGVKQTADVRRPIPRVSNETIVSVRDVSQRYKVGRNHVEALKNVSLDVYKGEFVAITGTSGSGKSTLLQLIGGLDKPKSGTIEVARQDLSKLRDSKLSEFRNHTIGFVFQFFYLQPFLNLQTNIEVPAMFAGVKKQERAARSQELAASIGLADRLRHLPRELSGGQMQRAAIARALQNKPSVLLADEPTGNLDRKNALGIFELFRQIRDEQGTTIVVVTHDLELATMADRSVTMSDGAIV